MQIAETDIFFKLKRHLINQLAVNSEKNNMFLKSKQLHHIMVDYEDDLHFYYGNIILY